MDPWHRHLVRNDLVTARGQPFGVRPTPLYFWFLLLQVKALVKDAFATPLETEGKMIRAETRDLPSNSSVGRAFKGGLHRLLVPLRKHRVSFGVMLKGEEGLFELRSPLWSAEATDISSFEGLDEGCRQGHTLLGLLLGNQRKKTRQSGANQYAPCV